MGSDKPDNATNWEADEDYEEYEIKEINLDRDAGERGMWIAKLEFDFVLRWNRGGKMPQPKVGQTCRVFGNIDGKWGPRGVVVNEKVVFFRTPEDQVKWVEAQEDALYIQAKLTFNTHETELQARFQALPENLRTRIEAAREVAEDKERFNVYELEVEIIKHEHAHMLALVVDGLPTLETFSMIPAQTQMGYSWNAMCEGRCEVIKKILNRELTKNQKGEAVPAADIAEEVLAQLREDLVYLDHYKEQRFLINHRPDVLAEIFRVAGELLAVEIAH